MGIYKNILIIYNPKAGRKRQKLFSAVLAELENKQINYKICQTEYAGHGEKLAKEYSENDDIDAIIAAGGDGTINEVINGIFGAHKPLGIIPLGTANVLAIEIGLEIKAEKIADTIAKSHIKKIYLGKINDHHFCLEASVGYDALAVQNVNLRLKKKIGQLAYFFSFIHQLIFTGDIIYNIELDGIPHTAYGAIITNSKHYGGKYICMPDASLTEHKLYALLFKKPGALNTIKYFFAILRDKLHTCADVDIIPVNQANISSSKKAPVQIEGDIYGDLPVSISTPDKPLLFIFPHR